MITSILWILRCTWVSPRKWSIYSNNIVKTTGCRTEPGFYEMRTLSGWSGTIDSVLDDQLRVLLWLRWRTWSIVLLMRRQHSVMKLHLLRQEIHLLLNLNAAIHVFNVTRVIKGHSEWGRVPPSARCTQTDPRTIKWVNVSLVCFLINTLYWNHAVWFINFQNIDSTDVRLAVARRARLRSSLGSMNNFTEVPMIIPHVYGYDQPKEMFKSIWSSDQRKV